MIPADYQLTIYEGDDFNRSITFKDDNDDLVDLTGYSSQMHIRNKVEDTAFIDWTSFITLGGVLGTIDINVPAVSTNYANWSYYEGVYDLELTSGAGAKFKLIRGTISVIREVTR